MNLAQLKIRVDALISYNTQHGTPERNELPILVELESYGPVKKNGRRSYKRRWFPLEPVRHTQYTIAGRDYLTARAQEADEVKL